ncbi:MAG: hypothetical protein US13_C0004G0019 [candidate division TM6 bacterium GW2011_GWE2_36_25]|nr:MAG: hypothetical protein US03_C0004G0019 [candidate division TM6 bacterium GW2011_GWF2_36_131]KKQ03197.1 MAG: hypothetical protein US13_C0004G0019 [candidate division TM6 bacterium GW2011_GWE2_36_25]KKQ18556.1 MAG: hypothetical protein US32_C0025G0020 [candidate division TM6 bacterium GW2011_GWA2_36_9]
MEESSQKACDENEITQLIDAIIIEDAELFQKLLEEDADVNQAGKYGITPLMVAAFANNPYFIEELMKHGADKTMQNDDGETALMYAVMGKNLDAVKIILQRGAHLHTRNIHGKTARMLAEEYSYEKLKKAECFGFPRTLLEEKDFPGGSSQDDHLFGEFLSDEFRLEEKIAYFDQPYKEISVKELEDYTTSRHKRRTAYFFENNLVAIDDKVYRITPKAYSAAQKSIAFHKISLYLLKVSQLNTQLFQAVTQGNIPLVKSLIEQGAQKDAIDVYGNTPIMRALLAKKRATVHYLLTLDVDLTIENCDGETAHSLAQCKKIPLFSYE